MSDELEEILILSSQKDFKDRLRELHGKLLRAARFGGFDKESEKKQKKVRDILRDVANNGYEAVRKYTKKFDKVDLRRDEFRVSPEQLENAHREIEQEHKQLLASVRKMIGNVRDYQTGIFVGNKKENRHPGIKYTPIKRVGICVPGASAPLPSTVIMTAVPAQVAGVKEIVVVSPPRYNKDIHPVTLAVCCELGLNEVYRVGGAQAVAVLASEKTIPKVDKIVGPGNPWVQTAKNMVSGAYAAIDSVAGPSEVLIIANDKANPSWVAADMLSQAEHAPGSAVLFTDSEGLAKKVLDELEKQVEQLDRAERTKECLMEFGKIAQFDNMDDVVPAANEFAAEHLEIQCGEESREIADRIENAGAIFIGDYSPVAVGDYWAGPSHTLPTGQTAKFFSALSANDFVKSISIIEYDKKKLADSAEDIIRLAETEGLDAHAKSIRIRQQS
ncbi:MAG TPA: histidinol dehydrogenase [Sedimentisphaerales bacterium]|nr:histidinol dehydrogenase [Sedimentisphaerales bacterium]